MNKGRHLENQRRRRRRVRACIVTFEFVCDTLVLMFYSSSYTYTHDTHTHTLSLSLSYTSSSSSSLFFQVLPSFVHVGSPIPPCWVASLLGPCGLGHRLHSLRRWICTFRPSLYHSILSGFKSGRTGYGMWCPWRAFGSWTPLIRPLWGLAGSLQVSSFLDIRHR